jgi:hypothetical protein
LGLIANQTTNARCPLTASGPAGADWFMLLNNATLRYTDNTTSGFYCSVYGRTQTGAEYWSANRYPCRSNTTTGCTTASNSDTGYSGLLNWTINRTGDNTPLAWQIGCYVTSGAQIVDLWADYRCVANP